jgi:hypothetical protein
MSAGIAVQTLSSREDVPGGARLFMLQPLDVTGEQVEEIDFLRVSTGGGLKIRVARRRLHPRCAPSGRRICMIANIMITKIVITNIG